MQIKHFQSFQVLFKKHFTTAHFTPSFFWMVVRCGSFNDTAQFLQKGRRACRRWRFPSICLLIIISRLIWRPRKPRWIRGMAHRRLVKVLRPQWSAKDQMLRLRATECHPRQDGVGVKKWTRHLKINVDSRENKTLSLGKSSRVKVLCEIILESYHELREITLESFSFSHSF